MAGSKTRNQSAVYFKSPSAFTIIVSIFTVFVTFVGIFNPEAIPDQYISVIGLMYRHIVYTKPWIIHMIGLAASLVHSGEAFYCLHLTNVKGVSDPATKAKWFLQTLIIGFGSLSLLIKYKPTKSKQ